MRRTRRQALFLSMLLCLLTVAGPVVLAGPPQQGQNLLINPGFEGGMRRTSTSSWVSDGWNPWYHHTGPGSEYYEPEWKVIQRPEDDGSADLRARLLDGDKSLQWFNTYALHDAGIWQRVKVPANAKVTFSVWIQIMSARDNHWVNDQMVSGPDDLGNYQVQIGIDPTGFEPTGQVMRPPGHIVWSESVWDANTKAPDGTNQYVQAQITAQAQGQYVTVWVRGWPKWAYRYEATFVDKASLVVVGAPSRMAVAAAPVKPTNTPVPTNTPAPTSTPTSTPTPTNTPMPTSTPTSTPTPTFTPTFTPSPTPTSSPTPLPTPTRVERVASEAPAALQAAHAPASVDAAGLSSSGSNGQDVTSLGIVAGISAVVLVIGLFIGKKMAQRP